MDDLFTSISVVYNASSNMWNVVPSLGYMPAAQYVHGAAEHAKRSAAKHTKKNNYENPEDLSEK